MASGKAVTGSLKLVSVLDLNEASVLHGQLSSMRGKDLSIDASGVDRVGVQCVQVLMAAANAWEEDKKKFVFETVSDAFRKTMQLIGINIDHLLAKEIQQ
ncbi:chemotaxis protein CheX [Rhizobium sp. RU35A]|uniref:STAS domain-containing protein n=1 Tax=Rhizobium straminoryzae TaxID=1387186 RepID=A0A549TII2_9HYPH|nr:MULTISPECIES: STAS domain-containing protein [Rhizobium]TRL43050.1 STAS domain-containing protein [Rhizobium straminoryzae]SIQ03055.1 chemotaxis protein CheX [Rhizobium sp. RU35A]